MFARTERLNSMRTTTEMRSATECFVTMAQASIPNFVEKCRSHSFSPIAFGRRVLSSVSHMWVVCRAFVLAIRNDRATHTLWPIDADRFGWRRPFSFVERHSNGIVFTYHARATFVLYVKYIHWMKVLRPYLTHAEEWAEAAQFQRPARGEFSMLICIAKTPAQIVRENKMERCSNTNTIDSSQMGLRHAIIFVAIAKCIVGFTVSSQPYENIQRKSTATRNWCNK